MGSYKNWRHIRSVMRFCGGLEKKKTDTREMCEENSAMWLNKEELLAKHQLSWTNST